MKSTFLVFFFGGFRIKWGFCFAWNEKYSPHNANNFIFCVLPSLFYMYMCVCMYIYMYIIFFFSSLSLSLSLSFLLYLFHSFFLPFCAFVSCFLSFFLSFFPSLFLVSFILALLLQKGNNTRNYLKSCFKKSLFLDFILLISQTTPFSFLLFCSPNLCFSETTSLTLSKNRQQNKYIWGGGQF